jgi:hypothetical protein
MTTTKFSDREILDRGATFIPLKPGSKIPAVPEGFYGKGRLQELTDEERKEMLEATRTGNKGLLTGPLRVLTEDGYYGLVSIDIDNKPARPDPRNLNRQLPGQLGLARLAELEAELGPLPPTLTSLTPGDGEHRHFWAPCEFDHVSNKVLGEGIEFMNDGHQVVYPGSVITPEVAKANGWIAGTYKWKDGRQDIAEIPAAWIKYILDHARPEVDTSAGESELIPLDADSPSGKRRLDNARRYLCERAPLSIKGCGGRSTFFKVCVMLIRRMRLPVDVAADLIERHYNPRLEAAGTARWSLTNPGPHGMTIVTRLQDAVGPSTTSSWIEAWRIPMGAALLRRSEA